MSAIRPISNLDFKRSSSVVISLGGLSEDIIEAVYKSYWKANKEIIEQIPLKNDYT